VVIKLHPSVFFVMLAGGFVLSVPMAETATLLTSLAVTVERK
jgi:hypothetical protein